MAITDTYLGRVGEELDRFINVTVLDGAVGQTVSMHAAADAGQGKLWACMLCRWLSWTVETDHCRKTLQGEAVKTMTGVRAGVQLIALATVLGGFYEWGVDALMCLIAQAGRLHV
jgi:hypothetical protein